MAEKIDAAVAVTPLVIVPADQLEKSLIEADAGGGVEDAGVLAMNEIGRNHFVRSVFEDAFQVGFGGFFHGLANFGIGGVFADADSEVDHADGGGGDAERHAGEFSLDFGADEADRFGGAGGGRDDVNGSGAAAFPIFTRRAIDRFLGGGVAVDGGHETFLHAETFFEKDMDEGSKTVGGAGGVGDDVVLGVVVLVVVHAHDDGDIFAFGRSRDDDLFAPGGDMAFGFVRFGKEAGGFNDVVDPEIFPGKSGGPFFDGETFDFMTIDDEDIVLGDGGGGFGAGDVEVEAALGGVVFDEIGEVVGGNEVIDRDHIKFFTEEALLAKSPKNKSPNSSEPIDRDFFIGHKWSKVAKAGRSVNAGLARREKRRSCGHRCGAKPVGGVRLGTTWRRCGVPKRCVRLGREDVRGLE